MSIDQLSLEQLKDLREVLTSLIDFSYASIIRNNFVESFYKYTINNRLHGIYKLFGAKSFRLTSNSPNMLNSPSTGSVYAKPVKKCFVAEPNHIFYMVDFASLEDHVIANLSKDKNKCAIFLSNVDAHCLNSLYYFKDEIEKELPRESNETDYQYASRYKEAVDNGNKKLKTIRQKSKPIT